MIQSRIPSLRATATFAFPQPFLHQFVLVEAFQGRVLAHRMGRRLAPEKAQQSVALLAQGTTSLPAAAGVFTRDQSHITGHRFAIGEPRRFAQEHFGAPAADAAGAICARSARWSQRGGSWV